MYETDYMCRSCLITEGALLSINQVLEEDLRIIDCFNVHLSMNISEYDDLPSIVCENCLGKLLEVRKFHLNCLESEEFLRKRFKKSSHQLKELQDEVTYTAITNFDALENYGTEQIEDIVLEEELENDLSHDPLIKIEPITNECEMSEYEDEEEPASDIDIHDKTSAAIDSSRARKGKHPVYCLQCHQKFPTKNILRKHFISVHSTDNEKGLCIQCSTTFPTRAKLMSHLHTHKRSVLRFQCTYCDKFFPEQNKLDSHVRSHTGERPFICVVCKKGFTQSCVLLTHMALHTGKKYSCSMCEKSFSRSSFLTLHLSVHSKERPFACHLCDKKFRLKCHLKEHVQTHSNVKVATCDICGQAFKHKSSLRMHMYNHTRKPYKCPMCPMEYKILYIFRKHLIEAHDIHEDPKLYKREEMDYRDSGIFEK